MYSSEGIACAKIQEFKIKIQNMTFSSTLNKYYR